MRTRAARSNTTSYASSGALQTVSSKPVVPRRDERVDGPDDLLDRRAGEVDRAGAVDLEIDESGSEQNVTEIAAPAGASPEPVATIRPPATVTQAGLADCPPSPLTTRAHCSVSDSGIPSTTPT